MILSIVQDTADVLKNSVKHRMQCRSACVCSALEKKPFMPRIILFSLFLVKRIKALYNALESMMSKEAERC